MSIEDDNEFGGFVPNFGYTKLKHPYAAVEHDYVISEPKNVTSTLVDAKIVFESCEPRVAEPEPETPHLSTTIKIMVDGKVVGEVQSINVIDEPKIEMLNSYKLICSRIRFDKLRIAEAFNGGFVRVQAQKAPMQISIEDKFCSTNCITTDINNCWVRKIGYSYITKDFIIAEGVELFADDVSSVLGKVCKHITEGIRQEEDERFLKHIDAIIENDHQLLDIFLVDNTVTPGAGFITRGVKEGDVITNLETGIRSNVENYLNACKEDRPSMEAVVNQYRIYNSLGLPADYNDFAGAQPYNSSVVLKKGRSVGKSTEVGADAINQMRDAMFAVEKELRSQIEKFDDEVAQEFLEKVHDKFAGIDMAIGKSQSVGTILDVFIDPDEEKNYEPTPHDGKYSDSIQEDRLMTAIFEGVTCSKCNDFNQYCSEPSESDMTHLCYKCRNGY